MTGVAVIDASSCADHLLSLERGPRLVEVLAPDTQLCAPNLLVNEVLSVIRRLALSSQIRDVDAEAAIADLTDYPVKLWDSRPLLPAMWRLREAMSAYDAAYVALAQGLESPLVTADKRLARTARRFVTTLVM